MTSSPSPRVASLLSLEGRCALITGASSGIGAHLAAVLHEAGADVVLCARRADRLQALAERLNLQRPGAYAVELDVSNAEQVGACFDRAEACFGGRVCDIVLNCAGVAMPNRAVDATDAEYDALMAVNQRGAFFVAREAARRLLRAGQKGSIVNIASIQGVRQGSMQTLYGMSKAAVIQMTKVMALELMRQGIRVNALAPGYFLSEMTEEFYSSEKGKEHIKRMPARRMGELHELDAALLFLASERASSFVTGVCLPVDGGHLLSAL
eukprot:CAMPEP_0177447950 /NCGR_PEP_ID=MMETSP0369-20130122/7908_1 /TAXON_ID=447022 ORGANISM="Scrippsiella hangoei-like, Strain SHHI-4" /NCGR_SAMPLE_ID=MMETSP0369 /ASSEMBLY_ACC=CAM_ASM_000364 /LENGTH=266 /DNA_ID=CAMNT_0018920311 /DNA_START=66 /DNA_END=866 /DNA_ORIENTATION=-